MTSDHLMLAAVLYHLTIAPFILWHSSRPRSSFPLAPPPAPPGPSGFTTKMQKPLSFWKASPHRTPRGSRLNPTKCILDGQTSSILWRVQSLMLHDQDMNPTILLVVQHSSSILHLTSFSEAAELCDDPLIGAHALVPFKNKKIGNHHRHCPWPPHAGEILKYFNLSLQP